MRTQDIANCNKTIEELGLGPVPDWIEQDITASTVFSICQSGCTSGAYMAACWYSDAKRTMFDYGEEVMEYINNSGNPEWSLVMPDYSWGQICCECLSYAVELWASNMLFRLEDLEEEELIDC